MSDRPSPTDATMAASAPGGRWRLTWLIVGGLVVVGLLALALSWYIGRDTPAAVDIQAATQAADAAAQRADGGAGDEADGGADADIEDADGASGTEVGVEDGDQTGVAAGELPADWVVDTELVAFDFDAGTGTFLGFRIDEELTTVGATTAVGRTSEVGGRLLLADDILDAASVTADLTALTTDIRQRDTRAQRAMNTDAFPTSTFELTEPVALGATPSPDEALEVDATGELTLSGVTRPTTAAIVAVLLDADRLLVTGSFEVVLADFGLVAPSAPIVVSVADTATIEFQLYLSPA